MPGIPPSDCLFQEPPCLDRFVKPAVPCWRPTPRLQPSRRARPANAGLGETLGMKIQRGQRARRLLLIRFERVFTLPRLGFEIRNVPEPTCRALQSRLVPSVMVSPPFPFFATEARSFFLCRVSSVLLTSIFFAPCDDCFIPPSNRSLAVAARILCFILASDF